MGALAMADRGYRADVGIMTEPTANTIAPICHGILWARVVIDGIGGHAELKPNSWDTSGPVDAIWLCRQMLDGFDILNRRWQFDPRKNHPLMDLPCQIILTQIKAGEHPSSMAGRGEIVIDVQYLPTKRTSSARWPGQARGRGAGRRSVRPTPICEGPGPRRMDTRRRLRRSPGRTSFRRRVSGGGDGGRLIAELPGLARIATSAFRPDWAHADRQFRSWRSRPIASTQRTGVDQGPRHLHPSHRALDRELVQVAAAGAVCLARFELRRCRYENSRSDSGRNSSR